MASRGEIRWGCHLFISVGLRLIPSSCRRCSRRYEARRNSAADLDTSIAQKPPSRAGQGAPLLVAEDAVDLVSYHLIGGGHAVEIAILVMDIAHRDLAEGRLQLVIHQQLSRVESGLNLWAVVR